MGETGFIKLTEEIRSSLDSGRFPHAVILEGASEQERRDTALVCAAALLCNGEGTKPCGQCNPCSKALSGNHPDILIIAGGEKANSFGVDLIREMRRSAYIIPNESDRKIYILHNASSMSEQAQNALLKILEEPPAYASFILECPSKAVLLQTVLSRCTAFSLGAESGKVKNEKAEKAREAAENYARSLGIRGEIETMKATAVFEKDKELLRLALPEIELILRDALVLKYSGETVSCSPETAQGLSDVLGAKTIMRLLKVLAEFTDMLARNANHNLVITKLCYAMRHLK